jgi:hypothetical protein
MGIYIPSDGLMTIHPINWQLAQVLAVARILYAGLVLPKEPTNPY